MNPAGMSPRPMRILVVAGYYPPSSVAAAIRARNIVQNMQALGHEVHVITARSGTGETPSEAHSLPWLNLEDAGQRLFRRSGSGSVAAPTPPPVWQVKLREATARVVVPDLRAPWIPIAVPAARRAARASDIVFSTGAASAHVVARIVRGKRPWVADINDFWWRNPHREVGALRERIDLRTEKAILEAATALTVPNEALGEEIRRRTGRFPTTVMTGFDSDEFQFDTPAPTTPHEVVFAGTLYTDFRLSVVLEALQQGRDERGWTPSLLRIAFYGSGVSHVGTEAAERGVDEFIAVHSAVPRREMLRKLVGAAALLFPLYPSDPFHLPMRFFDFVGSGRPFIGVGADTAPAAAMIRRHGLGVVCATVPELVSAFDDIARGSRPPTPDADALQLFELTSARPRLGELVDSVALP